MLALCWPEPSWEAALAAARTRQPAARWRQGLADALATVPGVHHARVFTCRPSRPERGGTALSDRRWRPLHQRLDREYVPAVEAMGLGFPYTLRRHGRITTLIERIQDLPVARAARQELLAPAGIRDCVCALFSTPRERLAGWLILAVTSPPGPFIAEHRGSLDRILDLATATLTVSARSRG